MSPVCQGRSAPVNGTHVFDLELISVEHEIHHLSFGPIKQGIGGALGKRTFTSPGLVSTMHYRDGMFTRVLVKLAIRADTVNQ